MLNAFDVMVACDCDRPTSAYRVDGHPNSLYSDTRYTGLIDIRSGVIDSLLKDDP